MGRRVVAVHIAVLVAAVALAGPAPAVQARPTRVSARLPAARLPAAQIRLDELGYLPHEAKRARLMVPRAVHGERFVVLDDHQRVVRRGRVPQTPVGRWNDSYRAVYRLTFDRLTRPGRYRIRTVGTLRVTSPPFRVLRAGRLFGTLLADGVRFDQVQRDGEQVISGSLHRRPSHLLDRSADVYAWPHMVPGEDTITDADLTRTGGPVDVEGGWFDAGDYLKFTHSTAYNDVLLLSSQRMLGRRAPRSLGAEARHGLAWLSKMWDPRTRTLHLQVGIGSGNRAGTFRGDHDGWRLPEADDQDTAAVDRYVAHRPVFDAAAPGTPISPNLAGRVSASFALAAQVDAARHPSRARGELHQARLVYAMAATHNPPDPLVTALPHDFYPESSWRDDMELGAAEIALASHVLGRGGRGYLRDGAHWAAGYLHGGDRDTLNLYDTSALAHADLLTAMQTLPATSHLQVSRADLLGDLRSQILRGVRLAHADPFAAGVGYDDFDVNSHTYGLIATVGLFDRLTRSRRFSVFATSQRTWLLGGDPWGIGSMVGVGTHFPLCMQHQVANLSGSDTSAQPLDVGAVVNGPNGADNFADGIGGFQDGMRHCTTTPRLLAQVDARGSRYVDDVRSWQTDEPALDMTGAAIVAAATQLTLHPHERLTALSPQATR